LEFFEREELVIRVVVKITGDVEKTNKVFNCQLAGSPVFE